jgi:hypothetical protein
VPVPAIGITLRIDRTALESYATSLLPALRGWDRTTRQERKRLKLCVLLLGHKPKVEVRRMLVDRKEIDAVGSSNSFDRRDKSSHDRTELDTLSRSHLAKIQKMPSGLDDYRSTWDIFSGACSTRKYCPSTM